MEKDNISDKFCMLCGNDLEPDRPASAPRAVCNRCAQLRENHERLCPFCRETIDSNAIKCSFCGETVDYQTIVREQKHTSTLAIVSLVLGIIGCMYCLPGIAGIVLGIIAKNQIKKSNGLITGNGLATWGIVCGSLWFLFWIALFIMTLFG